MKEDDRMTINERWKYLRLIQKRYKEADQGEKGRLLDVAESITGLNRKSLIRLLNNNLKRQPRKRQRGRTYGLAVQRALAVISESVDYICPERLQPNLVWLAKHLDNQGELEATPDLLDKLERISVPTIRRMLRCIEKDQPRLPRKGPREANQAARRVPIGRIAWDEQRPGYFEIDTVHHSGPSAIGHYVHSLQWIDVATGWSERVATLGRSQRVMEDGFRRILARLPFPICHIHSDNGGEFLNDHLSHFWEEENPSVTHTRGRPYKKNDQRFVEQKNDTLIRAYLGHERMDTVAHTQMINVLYNKMWLFYNFFQPVMRLEEKEMIIGQTGGMQIRRHHDQASTPFDRLCKTGVLPKEQQQRLEAQRQKTNPRQLRREIYNLLQQILALPVAEPGTTEDIFKTLMTDAEEKRLRWTSGYVDYYALDVTSLREVQTCPLL
jgi:hypothetical protein